MPAYVSSFCQCAYADFMEQYSRVEASPVASVAGKSHRVQVIDSIPSGLMPSLHTFLFPKHFPSKGEQHHFIHQSSRCQAPSPTF